MSKIKIFLSFSFLLIAVFIGWGLIYKERSVPKSPALLLENIEGKQENFVPAGDPVTAEDFFNLSAVADDEAGAPAEDKAQNVTKSTANTILDNLFSKIIEGGNLDSLDPEKFVSQITQEQKEGFTFIVAVDKSRLKILSDVSSDVKKKYLESFRVALVKNDIAIQFPDDESETGIDAFISGELKAKALRYLTYTADELYALAVPAKFLDFHTHAIENFEKAKAVYAAIINYRSDPLLALFAMQTLPEVEAKFEVMKQDLKKYSETYKD